MASAEFPSLSEIADPGMKERYRRAQEAWAFEQGGPTQTPLDSMPSGSFQVNVPVGTPVDAEGTTPAMRRTIAAGEFEGLTHLGVDRPEQMDFPQPERLQGAPTIASILDDWDAGYEGGTKAVNAAADDLLNTVQEERNRRVQDTVSQMQSQTQSDRQRYWRERMAGVSQDAQAPSFGSRLIAEVIRPDNIPNAPAMTPTGEVIPDKIQQIVNEQAKRVTDNAYTLGEAVGGDAGGQLLSHLASVVRPREMDFKQPQSWLGEMAASTGEGIKFVAELTALGGPLSAVFTTPVSSALAAGVIGFSDATKDEVSTALKSAGTMGALSVLGAGAQKLLGGPLARLASREAEGAWQNVTKYGAAFAQRTLGDFTASSAMIGEEMVRKGFVEGLAEAPAILVSNLIAGGVARGMNGEVLVNDPEAFNTWRMNQIEKANREIVSPETPVEAKRDLIAYKKLLMAPKELKLLMAPKEEVAPEAPEAKSAEIPPVKAEVAAPAKAETDLRLGEKGAFNIGGVVQFIKKWLGGAKGVETKQYEAALNVPAQVKAKMYIMDKAAGDTLRAVDKIKDAAIRQTNKDNLDAALKGDAAALAALEPSVRANVDIVRAKIDELTQYAIDNNIVTGDLKATFQANKGIYVRRAYELFEKPEGEWAKDVRANRPELIKAAEGLIASQEPTLTPEQVTGRVNALLDNMRQDEQGVIGTGKVGSKDISSLIRREDIPEEIRNLWGEIKDFEENALRTTFSVSKLIAQTEANQTIAAEGLKSGIFTTEPDATHTQQVNKEKTNGHAPGDELYRMYTTPEYKKVLDTYNQDFNIGSISFFLKAAGMSKWAVTVGNIQSQERNVISNPGLLLGQGYFRVNKSVDAAKALVRDLGNGTPESRAKMEEYIRLRVVGGMNISELIAGASTAKTTPEFELTFDSFKNTTPSLAKKAALAPFKALNWTYKWGDQFFRIMSYENELAQLKAAHPNENIETLKVKAADKTNAVMPSTDYSPRVIKAIRKIPVLSGFVTWHSEMIRTALNTYQLAGKEMMTPGERDIGAKRMASMTAVLAAQLGSYALASAAFGTDKEDEKAVRDFTPPWTKNSPLIIPKIDKNAKKVGYVDVGWSLPHSVPVKTLMGVAMAPDNQKVGVFAQEFLGAFLSGNPLSQKVLEINANQDANGRKIYDKDDLIGDKVSKAIKYALSSFKSGTITQLQNAYLGAQGKANAKGVVQDIKTPLITMFSPVRYVEFDVPMALGYKLRDFDSRLRDATSALNRELTRKGPISDDEIKAAWGEYQRKYGVIVDELNASSQSAERLGMNRMKIMKAMMDARVDKDLRRGWINKNAKSNLRISIPERVKEMEGRAAQIRQAVANP